MTMPLPSPLPLARNYYETRRKVLEAGGTPTTPWYQLGENERAVAVAEAVIILEAIRLATEEEQALQDAVRRSGISGNLQS
ncbi:hypothetical protein [Streptomyces sp. BH055]|uniref:hypothetical protein n=1 Tax=unclassified Streptomyces TaxID=2593676 RepID=UPI003BB6EA84